ncbi:MAG: hypothetical protein K6B41_08770 [Butyrivibrio sp.]|nr:hypothetical protein [Butyrivibrio sp.]
MAENIKLINISNLDQGTIMIDFAALFLLIVILIHTNMYRKRSLLQDKLFFSLAIIDVVIAVFDLGDYTLRTSYFPFSKMAVMISEMVFWICFELFAFLFVLYLMCMSGKSINVKKNWVIYGIPAGVELIVIISNLFTGFLFYVDESNEYVEGFLFNFVYIGAFCYLIAACFQIIKISKTYFFVLVVLLVASMAWKFTGIDLFSTAFNFALVLAYSHINTMNDEFYKAVKE